MCERASHGRARPIAARETLIRIIQTQRCRHFSAKLPLDYRQDAVNSARTHTHTYGFKRKTPPYIYIYIYGRYSTSSVLNNYIVLSPHTGGSQIDTSLGV